MRYMMVKGRCVETDMYDASQEITKRNGNEIKTKTKERVCFRTICFGLVTVLDLMLFVFYVCFWFFFPFLSFSIGTGEFKQE